MRMKRARKNADPEPETPSPAVAGDELAVEPAIEEALAVEHPPPVTSPPEAVENDDDEDDEEEDADPAPPKLAEGYYEIEDLRKKRTRKGQLQYLVKWRGWPETANTWEPADNLNTCADIVEAFEERMRTPKSRKRRRSSSGPPTSSKKKRPPPAVQTEPDKVNVNETDDEEKAPTEPAGGYEKATDGDEIGPEDEPAVVVEPTVGGSISIDLPHEDGAMDVSSKTPADGGNLFKGARKRKSGSIRRFKQELAAGGLDGGAVAAKPDNNGACRKLSGAEFVDSTDDAGEKGVAAADVAADPKLPITKIVKPVRFKSSIIDDVQQVAITFKAIRSDGQEVLVDDKHLKANNPLLLIGYYEQHLRYNPQP